jgi:hypothetical protein
MIRAERAARIAAEAEATGAKADVTSTEALTARLKATGLPSTSR